MTNKENFKEDIFEIACKGDAIAVEKKTNKPCGCEEIGCNGCALVNKTGSCRETLALWLEEEYVEPCPFEEGELVEVSDDGENWHLGYFSHIGCGYYFAYFKGDVGGLGAVGHKYCQKYGTLGGLVKDKQNEEAIEKQKAKKPLMRYENMGISNSPNERFKVYGCPCCKEEIDEETSFCQNCGQKIDWKGEQ